MAFKNHSLPPHPAKCIFISQNALKTHLLRPATWPKISAMGLKRSAVHCECCAEVLVTAQSFPVLKRAEFGRERSMGCEYRWVGLQRYKRQLVPQCLLKVKGGLVSFVPLKISTLLYF